MDKLMDKLKVPKSEVPKLDIVKKYKKIFIVIIILLFIVTIGYFLSEYYNVNRTLNKLKIFPKYMEITSKLHTDKFSDLRLCDFYVASSYRSALTREQGYSSIKILREVLRSGARFLWFDIFNENLALDTEPVISHGYEKGNWCYTGNLTKFDDCCKLLLEVAFTSKLVNNYNDPLIIALNLNVTTTLNLVCDLRAHFQACFHAGLRPNLRHQEGKHAWTYFKILI